MEDRTQRLRVTHDDEADAAYIYLTHPRPVGAAGRTIPVALPDTIPASILLDFDAENRLIGVEILGARRALPEQLLDPPLPPGAPRYVRWRPRPFMAEIDLEPGALGKVTDWSPTAVQVTWVGRESDDVTQGAVYDAEDLEPATRTGLTAVRYKGPSA